MINGTGVATSLPDLKKGEHVVQVLETRKGQLKGKLRTQLDVINSESLIQILCVVKQEKSLNYKHLSKGIYSRLFKLGNSYLGVLLVHRCWDSNSVSIRQRGARKKKVCIL